MMYILSAISIFCTVVLCIIGRRFPYGETMEIICFALAKILGPLAVLFLLLALFP